MLKNQICFAVIFLVIPYCSAMENQDGKDSNSGQPPVLKEGPRAKVVTFAVPVDDRTNQDTEENDPPHRPMKRPPSRQSKKGTVLVALLEQSDERSYWKRFISCLCRLARAEFDENNFYPSLRD